MLGLEAMRTSKALNQSRHNRPARPRSSFQHTSILRCPTKFHGVSVWRKGRGREGRRQVISSHGLGGADVQPQHKLATHNGAESDLGATYNARGVRVARARVCSGACACGRSSGRRGALGARGGAN